MLHILPSPPPLSLSLGLTDSLTHMHAPALSKSDPDFALQYQTSWKAMG